MSGTEEFTSVTPYLRYPDGDAAVEWLTRVLGFGPSKAKRDAGGHLAEGTIHVGPVRVELNGGSELGPGSGAGALLIVGVTDVDAQCRRIRDAGVDIDLPRDEVYGPRTCHVTDPWGYQWYFWQGDAVYPQS